MSSAVSFREEDWRPFPEETVTDLLKFLEDGEGVAEPQRVELAPIANDNWPLHIESVRVNELPPIVIWRPSFRTAD